LLACGASEALVVDIHDRQAMQRAMSGATAVYHICPNVYPYEVEVGEIMLAAARTAGIERFVYHSVLHPQIKAMPHHWKKMRVEEMIFATGIDYTILQPAAYMQNVLAQWDVITEKGIYPIPYSTQSRLGMVDLEDVAEAAAVVLTTDEHIGATYELAGAQALTQDEVAQILSAGLGREVRAVEISRSDWIDRSQAAGMPEYAIETLSKMFEYYDRHGLWGNSNVLEGLLGRHPVSFSDFIRRTIAA
jgi:NAD(P)H dehydrogenase (quinone)